MSKKNNKQQDESIDSTEYNNEEIQPTEPIIDELAERKAKYKKLFPYSEFSDYLLSEDELAFIDNLDERKLKSEDIAEFKRLHKDIWNDSFTFCASCGSSIALIKQKLVKLKLFRNTQ